jgi:hypothetical protein
MVTSQNPIPVTDVQFQNQYSAHSPIQPGAVVLADDDARSRIVVRLTEN